MSGIFQCVDPAVIAAELTGALDLSAISDDDIYDFHSGNLIRSEGRERKFDRDCYSDSFTM